MNKKKLLVGNLKMNILSPAERESYFTMLKRELKNVKLEKTQVVICPPVIHLESFSKKLPKKIKPGAQNVFWEDKGSFTGEISPVMLKNFGCEYAIVGHSERRRYFLENDEGINLKIQALLRSGISPIICVGETKEERRRGKTMRVITEQIRGAFLGLTAARLENLIVVYEPIWSVGTDEIPSANEIMEAKVLIQKILSQSFPKKYVEMLKIIYGGSVSAKTAKQTCLDSGMDGALVGRESLAPFEFLKIAKLFEAS
jgi:triosephosphate isomerase